MSSERKQRSAAAAARCDLACGVGHDLLAEVRKKLTPRLLEPLQTGSKPLPSTQRAFSPDADRAESLRERERLVRDMFQSATAMQLHNREVEKQLRAERDSLRVREELLGKEKREFLRSMSNSASPGTL